MARTLLYATFPPTKQVLLPELPQIRANPAAAVVLQPDTRVRRRKYRRGLKNNSRACKLMLMRLNYMCFARGPMLDFRLA